MRMPGASILTGGNVLPVSGKGAAELPVRFYTISLLCPDCFIG